MTEAESQDLSRLRERMLLIFLTQNFEPAEAIARAEAAVQYVLHGPNVPGQG